MRFSSPTPHDRERSRLLTAAALGLLLLLAGAAWLLSGTQQQTENLAVSEEAEANEANDAVDAAGNVTAPNTDSKDRDKADLNSPSSKDTDKADLNTAADAAAVPDAAPETAATSEAAAATGESADAAQAAVSQAAANSEDDTADRPHIQLSRLLNDNWEMQRAYGFDYNPNSEDYRFHRGCDLSAADGQPVFAPADGVVREAAEDAYWGGFIIIDFPGWTAIVRCVTPRVESGQQVKAGDFIASVCLSPAEAAQDPHLHIEIETDGQSFDPSLYF